jgi:hypothetical protein
MIFQLWSASMQPLGRLLSISFLLLLLLLPDAVQAGPDKQYWNQFTFKTKPGWLELKSVKISLEQRFIDDASDFSLWNLAVTPIWEIYDWLDFGVEYKHEREDKSSGWEKENRFTLVPVVHWKTDNYSWSLRTKGEYRTFSSDEKWRIRERFKGGTKVNWGDKTLKPYFSEELFYDVEAHEFNQNRVALGVDMGVGKKNPSLSLYYIHKGNKKSGDWMTTHVLGTEWGFSF